MNVSDDKSTANERPHMIKTVETKEDGRLLIYYSFETEKPEKSTETKEHARKGADN
ncbi:MAG: hypothetical protein ACRD3W_29330 [Terriglobales bacterium]